MNKQVYRWAGLVFGASVTALALGGCAVQNLLGGLLGSIPLF